MLFYNWICLVFSARIKLMLAINKKYIQAVTKMGFEPIRDQNFNTKPHCSTTIYSEYIINLILLDIQIRMRFSYTHMA